MPNADDDPLRGTPIRTGRRVRVPAPVWCAAILIAAGTVGGLCGAAEVVAGGGLLGLLIVVRELADAGGSSLTRRVRGWLGLLDAPPTAARR